MNYLLRYLATACVIVAAGCTSAAPPAPTTAPPPTTAPTTAPRPSVSVAPSPAASPSPSPAAAAKPAASPAGSPVSSPAAAPSPSPLAAGSPVAIPQMVLQGTPTPGFVLSSSAFNDNDTFPTQFSCVPSGGVPNGATSPPLSWSGAPSSARVFALIEQDMDVPPPNGPVVHWLIFNIPASVTSLAQGLPQVEMVPNGAMQGVNSLRTLGYIGSCPPPGAAAHHYVFQLFALDAPLTVRSPATLPDVQPAMQGHVLAQTQLRSTFGR